MNWWIQSLVPWVEVGWGEASFFFPSPSLSSFLSYCLLFFLLLSRVPTASLSVCFLVFFPFTCPFSVLIPGCACLSFSLSLTFLLVSLTRSVHLYLCLSNAVSSLSDPLSCVSPHLSVCFCLFSYHHLCILDYWSVCFPSTFGPSLSPCLPICLSICLSLFVCLSLCASVSVSSCLCLFIVLSTMFC